MLSVSKIILLIPISAAAISLIAIVWLDKVLETNGVINSYYTRLSDVIISLEIWKENLFLGTGYHNENLFVITQGLGRKSSNGFLTWCYTMGLLGVILVLYPFVYRIINDRRNRIEKIVFLVLFIVTNMTEPLMDTPIMLLIIGYQYFEKRQKI